MKILHQSISSNVRPYKALIQLYFNILFIMDYGYNKSTYFKILA